MGRKVKSKNTGIALAVAATVVLGGWLQSPAADRVDCWFDPPGDATVECFRILVPRDYVKAEGATFDLAVAVVRGEKEARDRPAVVLVGGGPGGPSFDSAYPQESLVSRWFDITQRFRREHDIVIFDARGVGRSLPSLDCHEANQDAGNRTDPPGSDVSFYRRQSESIRACWDRLAASGLDFAAVSTTAMADDIATIAQELGYDTIDLWSFSFGTRVGLEVIRRHPDIVRAAVLDSTVPTHGSLDNDLPWMTWRAFEQLFDDCEQDSRCSNAYPNVRDNFLDQVESLNEDPQMLALIDIDRWGEGAAALVTGDDLVFYAYDAFYSTDVLRYLPAIIEAGTQDLNNLTAYYWFPLLADWGLSEGVFLTIVCREIVPFTDEAEVEAQAGMYGPIGDAGAAMAMAPACSDWPVEPMLREDRSPVVSAAPVLFLNGAYDPATPPEWSVEIAEDFSNSVHLVFRGAGHTPSATDACAVRTAVRFLQRSGDSEPFTEPYCRLYREPPDFLIP